MSGANGTLTKETKYKTIVQNFVNAWNAGDLGTAFSAWAPDIIHHSRLSDNKIEGIELSFDIFMRAFPNIHIKVNDMVAEGNKVVSFFTVTGTHVGEFMGKPATGKQISWSSVDISVFNEDDKVCEHWGLYDEMSIFSQVGLLPIEFLASMS
ncbi:MAG: ester cyclase [Anaerolinea sp.]|nr:ester cyclase [Anaerolinea sp.]